MSLGRRQAVRTWPPPVWLMLLGSSFSPPVPSQRAHPAPPPVASVLMVLVVVLAVSAVFPDPRMLLPISCPVFVCLAGGSAGQPRREPPPAADASPYQASTALWPRRVLRRSVDMDLAPPADLPGGDPETPAATATPRPGQPAGWSW
ncbi:hypothetical protein BCD49_32740 [Pseudofrankia sp. EUN1h]|nr:hypothetical protein BCD49_32740 [Pseudofrankia sp. EUN1h]